MVSLTTGAAVPAGARVVGVAAAIVGAAAVASLVAVGLAGVAASPQAARSSVITASRLTIRAPARRVVFIHLWAIYLPPLCALVFWPAQASCPEEVSH